MSITERTKQDLLPCGLAWHVEPAAWGLDDERLRVTAGPSTDNFIDPGGAITVLNGARALVRAPRGPWQFSTCVTPDFAHTYDAGALLVWVDDPALRQALLRAVASRRGRPWSRWSPAVCRTTPTAGWPDLAEGQPTPLRRIRVPLPRCHHQAGELVRYFHLDQGEPVEIGLAAQSPLGPGCTVEFTEVTFTDNDLTEIGDGS